MLCTVMWAILSAREGKVSVLFLLCLRKLRQFDVTLFLFGPQGLMDCTHQRQYVYPCISWHKHALWVERSVLNSTQRLSMFLVVACSPTLNHQWWWHQCLAFGLEMWLGLKNGGQLRSLVFKKFSTITQHRWEGLILTLEEILHVTFSALTGDEVLRIVGNPPSLTSALMVLQ